ncbi:MAG: hypothetical protein WC322_00175 [Candidatus Paceibacterota bacterium]|jgi:hypothetical protein
MPVFYGYLPFKSAGGTDEFGVYHPPWGDIDGVPHELTQAEFLAIAGDLALDMVPIYTLTSTNYWTISAGGPLPPADPGNVSILQFDSYLYAYLNKTSGKEDLQIDFSGRIEGTTTTVESIRAFIVEIETDVAPYWGESAWYERPRVLLYPYGESPTDATFHLVVENQEFSDGVHTAVPPLNLQSLKVYAYQAPITPPAMFWANFVGSHEVP